jgi:hypothetical protein
VVEGVGGWHCDDGYKDIRVSGLVGVGWSEKLGNYPFEVSVVIQEDSLIEAAR